MNSREIAARETWRHKQSLQRQNRINWRQVARLAVTLLIVVVVGVFLIAAVLEVAR